MTYRDKQSGAGGLSVTVVGGGVFGGAVAYHLARRGCKTTLVEQDDWGAHASGKNPGNLNPILGAAPTLIPLTLHAFERHRVLAAELAGLGCAAYDLRPLKRVLLAFDADDQAELEATERLFAGVAGFAATRLGEEAVRGLDRRLSPAVASGLLLEGNMSLDSRAFTAALVDGAARWGATILRGRVSGLASVGGRVRGVRVADQVLACDAVVLATGAWLAESRDWLGVAPPVTPLKGQLLRVRLPGAGLRHDFTHGIVSLYRRGVDECWIGVTREDAGFDETPTGAERDGLLRGAARIMPCVGQATLLEHVAALRPMSPDGRPVVGRVPGWENAYVAGGGGHKGILLCPGVGETLAAMVVGEIPIQSVEVSSS